MLIRHGSVLKIYLKNVKQSNKNQFERLYNKQQETTIKQETNQINNHRHKECF